MLETDLRKRMADTFKALSLDTSVEPVENLVNLGTFDTFCVWPGGGAWIELKIQGPNEAPALRPGQRAFGVRMVRARFPAFVLIGHEDGSVRLLQGDTSIKRWRDYLIYRGGLREACLAVMVKGFGEGDTSTLGVG